MSSSRSSLATAFFVDVLVLFLAILLLNLRKILSCYLVLGVKLDFSIVFQQVAVNVFCAEFNADSIDSLFATLLAGYRQSLEGLRIRKRVFDDFHRKLFVRLCQFSQLCFRCRSGYLVR